MMHSPSIPKSPDPKEQAAAARDCGTRVNASESSAGHSGLRLPDSCRRGPLWAPALGTAPPPPCSPKPQSASRCAAGTRRGAPSPPGDGGRPGTPGREAAAPSPPAPARPPRSGPRKWPSPRGESRAAAEPPGPGPGPQPGGRGSNGRGRGARSGTGRRAPATRSARPQAPLTQLGDVGLSFRSRMVRLGRRLPRAARCPSSCPQLAITGTTKSTWSPNSLKSTSSRQPLICIPEVAPRSPVRAPLSPPSPRSSPAARCCRLAGGTRRRRGGVWGWLAVSLLGKQQSSGCLRIFPARLSGLL